MSQSYIGEIRLFAGNFAPVGWSFCDGQLLDISQNDALFTLIGTSYGGDGQTTFALPDLRGRAPAHQGSSFMLGQPGGVEQVTLNKTELPGHTHQLLASSSPGSRTTATGNALAMPVAGGSTVKAFTPAKNPDSPLGVNKLELRGGSQAHNNMQPYLTINFIIALAGIFPSQT